MNSTTINVLATWTNHRDENDLNFSSSFFVVNRHLLVYVSATYLWAAPNLKAAGGCQSPDLDFRRPEKIKLFRKLFPLFQGEKFVSVASNYCLIAEDEGNE